MLSSVLHSDKAIEMNIVIVRAFITLRQFALNYKDLEAQIQSIWLTVNSHDEQLKMIYSAIESLLAEKDKQKSWEEREMIGFGDTSVLNPENRYPNGYSGHPYPLRMPFLFCNFHENSMRSFYLLLLLSLCLELPGQSQPGPLSRTPGVGVPARMEDFSSQPVLAWKFSARQPFFASPVIDDGRVYVGNNDSTLYCLDIGSGQLAWKFATKGPVRSGVCVDKDRLFLIGGDSGVYCLNKGNGRVNWVFRTGGERMYDQYDYYQSTPVIRGDTLFFGSGDGNIYALNSRNGALIWKFRTENVVHGKPALYNGHLYVGSFDGYTYALNTSDGSLVWKLRSLGQRFFPKGEMQFSPVVAGGLVFIGSRDFNLYAIDAEKGYCHWNRQYPRGWAPVITATHHDSAVLVGTSDDKVLLLLRTEDGREIWRADVKFNVFGASVLTAGMCYTATLMGKVFGIHLRTGAIAWSFATDSYRTGRLQYFKENDTYRDDIFSIIHSQEEYLAFLNKIGAVYSSPAADATHIVFSSTEGTVYCLKRA